MKISRTSGETPQNAPAPQPKTQPTPAPAPKPRRKPKPEPEYEEDDDEEEEEHRRHFPVGCLIVIIILALLGFGAYKGLQFYSEIDGGTAVQESAQTGRLVVTASDAVHHVKVLAAVEEAGYQALRV